MASKVRSASVSKRWTRTIKVAPIPRAVRSAMAASAMVLAGTGTVFAAGAPADANTTHTLRYDVAAANALAAGIQPEDLTLVAGSSLPAPTASNAVSAGLRLIMS